MEIPTKTLRRSATLLALAASATMAVAELRPPRPNVLVIMPDDVSFDDFSYYRQDGPQTPNIDALARESVRFTDFHVSPTCSPTRAALLTGRSANATGVWHTILGRYFLHPDEITLADIMRRNGYATALFSKWHLGDSYPFRPQDRGFDTVCVVKGGGITQQPNPWGNRNVPPARIEDNGRWIELTDEDDGIPGAFATNYFSSRAIEHMRDQVRRGMPFFVMLAYNAAHAPHDRPPDARPGISARDATIENIDKNVGRVLNFLKENGLERDTLVLFLTDNGETARGLRGRKASHYEGGHRVPCFLRWPARGYGGSPETSREIETLAAHIDLVPSLIDLLKLEDVKRPAELAIEGRSLRRALDGADEDLRGRIVVIDNQRRDHLQKYKQAAVMRDEFDAEGRIHRKWRLVSADEAGRWELYDVLGDPRQKRDLAAVAEHRDVVKELAAAYEDWWSRASRRADDYARIVLGSVAEPATCLYAHDWHTEGAVPWDQVMVAEGQPGNGFHAVSFARDGVYLFDLRRWPREIASETNLDTALSTPIIGRGGRTTGKALPIRSACLKIWRDDQVIFNGTLDAEPDADGVQFRVPVEVGPAMVQSWFYDEDGDEIAGAYYIYVERVER